MKVIVSEGCLGVEYIADAISSCEQNGIECIADDKGGVILYYDPKGRKYADSKYLMNSDTSIHELLKDKKLYGEIMQDAVGEGFKKFAIQWNALQKEEDDEVYKTKHCNPIRGNFSESNKIDSAVVYWKDKSEEPMTLGDVHDLEDAFDAIKYILSHEPGDIADIDHIKIGSKVYDRDDIDDYLAHEHELDELNYMYSENIDNRNDWSASDGEVEIMWDTNEHEDFGILRGDCSTYLIDYDRVDTHDDLIRVVCMMISKEYPDLDFEPDDFVVANEDECWEQRGGMYTESESNGRTLDVTLSFTRGHYGKNLKVDDERTIKVDLDAAPELYDEDDLMDWISEIASDQIPGGGTITKYYFKVLDMDRLVNALTGGKGFGTDLDIDIDDPDSIPSDISYKDAVNIYKQIYDAYDNRKLNYNKFDVLRKKVVDSVVAGLLKGSSIEELAKEWFIDYGTRNGWGWKTSFRYNIAAALHAIHMKKHPDEHRRLPQHNHWSGWHEDNCSCGLASSSDSSD